MKQSSNIEMRKIMLARCRRISGSLKKSLVEGADPENNIYVFGCVTRIMTVLDVMFDMELISSRHLECLEKLLVPECLCIYS